MLAKTLHFLNQRRVFCTAPAYNLPPRRSEVGNKGTLFFGLIVVGGSFLRNFANFLYGDW